MKVEIFCDGACSGNPGVGGWGSVLRYRGAEKELSGSAAETTNNRMELTAAIEALASLTRPCRVVVTTDSQYLMKGMTEWSQGWVRGHNGHPENERCDELARRAIEEFRKNG